MTLHYAIVLAAGFSTRMGSCKADLPWQDGHTLLSYQVTNFLRAEIVPIIIFGTHNYSSGQHCPPGSQIVLNRDASRGKISSILTGLQALPDSFLTVTISSVDQPRSLQVYEGLLQAYQVDRPPIVAPSHNQKMGHPLLFCRSILPHLWHIEEANQGLRAIVTRFYPSIRFVEWDSVEVLQDLNSPAAYWQSKGESPPETK